MKNLSPLSKKDIKIIGLSSVGGALEFFEFTIYALFANYISQHFFPQQDPIASLMSTFGIYALGYLARPLGGIFFGHIGDKYGRKKAFTITILLMASATLAIGCLPSYQTIGIASPLILIGLRLLQGFSVGGEIAGATVFTTEHLPDQRRGLGIGIVFVGITSGNILGGLIGFILNAALGSDIMAAWGWRIPFAIGFLLGLFSYFIRKHTVETPVFQEIAKKELLQELPFFTLLKAFYQPLLIGICLMAVPSTIIAFFLFLPTYLTAVLKFNIQQPFLLNITSFSILCLMTLVFGFLSDYIRRKYLVVIGCCALVVNGYLAFYFFLQPNFLDLLIFISLLGSAAGIVNGCYALMIVELFPANVRYSGMATSYSIGVALFGGLGPLIFTFLSKQGSTGHGPYFYLIFVILLTIASMFFYKKIMLIKITFFSYSRTMVPVSAS